MPRRKIKSNVIDNSLNIYENNIDLIDKIYFINLESRKDRKESIINEIKKIDPELKKTLRIEATFHEKGHIGCGMSHVKTLEHAIENNYENIVILEDDFVFTSNVDEIKKKINYIITKKKDYNICLLAGNIFRCRKIDTIISSCINVQTTSGYLINKRFFSLLKEVFSYAVNGLINNKDPKQYSIDIMWKKLQDDNFYIFNPKLGKQKESYSDIEKRIVNYNV